MSTPLRFRQVHLDFHTSPHIPGIGTEFDPEAFVHTLKEAAVDSITCFSRCHHGYIYHDTRFPYRHPHLTCNLLIEQLRACHAADIRVPVYVTVGWDQLMGDLHPEWLEVDAEGRLNRRKALSTGWGWPKLDFASPYIDFVVDQTREIGEMLGDELDGVFFDIIFQQHLFGPYCLERFAKLGWDPADPARQAELRQRLLTEVTDRLAAVVRKCNPEATVFFNGGHVGPDFQARIRNYSHLELESLPSGGWGYNHFPMTARYARTLGLEFLGMTGKFSESWGHFGSYKNPVALEYECFQALAQGGQCSVGDQLHPRGVLDAATYDLIGGVYRQVRDVEPWCQGAKAVTEIAVVNAELFDLSSERMDPRNLGAARMLIEGRHQFDFVDFKGDWSTYSVLILPDGITLSADQAAQVQAFAAGGGAVIGAAESLLDADGAVLEVFASCVKAQEGPLACSPDYLRAEPDLGLLNADAVMYERGIALRAADGAEVLAHGVDPYFERGWTKFCSHAHTPAEQRNGRPGVLVAGRIAAFAHPIFTTYAKHSMSFHRDLVLKVLERLLPQPLVELPGPTSLQATLTRQGDRHLVHLLHYIPERRALNFDVIEDPMPVAETEVRVRVPFTRATLVPSGETLEVVSEGVVRVPAFIGRAMVCLEG